VPLPESFHVAHARHRSRHLGLALLVFSFFVVVSAASQSAPLDVDDGGIDDAVGCTTPDCIASETFGLEAFAAVTGTVDIDSVGLTIDIDLDVAAVSLTETVIGTEDNGVAEVEFTTTNYFATGVAISEGVPNSYSIDFPSEALVEGDQTQWNDVNIAVNSTPALFTRTQASITGNCFVVDPSNATCSFSFGTTGFSLDVGDPTPAPRHFRHTMSLVLIPEPEGWTMLASGTVGLLFLARRRRSRRQ
jgi:hypothetical protein